MKNTLQVIQMEKFVRQSLLYDFYGELLTQTQKSIYEDVVMNDLSYSELAREYGISRQGVFDMMKRCDKKLEDFEKKLKLVEKFENKSVLGIHDVRNPCGYACDDRCI